MIREDRRMLDARQQELEDEKKWNILRRLHGDRRLKVRDLRVAYFLLVGADCRGDAVSPLNRLAKLTGASVPDVERSINDLARLGYFTARFMPATAENIGVSVH
jgi:hypothetical protein